MFHNHRKIVQDGRIEIPQGTPQKRCRYCNGIIFWVITRNGKNQPVGPDGTFHRCQKGRKGGSRKSDA